MGILAGTVNVVCFAVFPVPALGKSKGFFLGAPSGGPVVSTEGFLTKSWHGASNGMGIGARAGIDHPSAERKAPSSVV